MTWNPQLVSLAEVVTPGLTVRIFACVASGSRWVLCIRCELAGRGEHGARVDTSGGGVWCLFHQRVCS